MRSLLLLALLALPQNTAPAPAPASTAGTPLAHEWIPVLGDVRIDALGPLQLRITVAGEKPRSFDLDLEGLKPGARVREAHATHFVDANGIALAIAIEQGAATSYHYLLSFPMAEGSGRIPLAPDGRAGGWYFSPALFTSTDTPYRIAEIHCPGGDGFEIAFRRGWPSGVGSAVSKLQVDEKLYFNTCMGAPGAGVLVDVTSVQTVR
jgi:hypothetical protein